MRGFKTYSLPNTRYVDAEFKEWCGHYTIDGAAINPASDEAEEALLWTGGVPCELRLLLEKEAMTLWEKTRLYREERSVEMNQGRKNLMNSELHGKAPQPSRHSSNPHVRERDAAGVGASVW